MPTKSDFLAYRRVQQSGKYNMIVDSAKAAAEANLSIETYFAVIEHYSELSKLYGSSI